jgi:hypothetical protein
MTMKPDSTTAEMDEAWLRMNLSFEVSYIAPDDAEAIRKHWRRVARRAGIKIRTFNWKQRLGGQIIVERVTELPGDEFVKNLQMEDARQRLNAYLGHHES